MCLLTDILSYLFLDAGLYYKGTTIHTVLCPAVVVSELISESPVAWETHRLLNALGPQGATSYTRPVQTGPFTKLYWDPYSAVPHVTHHLPPLHPGYLRLTSTTWLVVLSSGRLSQGYQCVILSGRWIINVIRLHVTWMRMCFQRLLPSVTALHIDHVVVYPVPVVSHSPAREMDPGCVVTENVHRQDTMRYDGYE